ncbi:odorant receptor 131-2-like [Acipenser ruthenus]|uniref:odorant receptor 131-2-like n=1 Tax=Acipenser ruthenus TaxID=7906 RepID=UPI0027417966|nr:odorant receptor 131-2-like [Acipenser ruthenus]
MNSTEDPSDTTLNSSGASAQTRDTFDTAVAKNVIIVFLCIFINYINGTLVFTFFKNRMFHEASRYILFIHMVINDIIQLTVAVTLFVVSYILFKINASFCCFLLSVAIFASMNTPLSLAAMAIERYVAICNPLRAVSILPDVFILLATAPLSFFHSSVFCARDYVFRSPDLVQKRSILHAVYLAFVWLTLTYTYFRILFTAKAATTDATSAAKARNTILLHGVQLLLCMLTYIGPTLEYSLLYIFPGKSLEIRYFIYLVVQVLPRFLSPMTYGVRDQMFRKYLKRHFLCKTIKDGQLHPNNNHQTS